MTNNKRYTINKKEVEIVQKEAPVLRKTAKAVPIKDIKSKKIQDVIKRMKKALSREEDGVAIAAPQIGESLRIFVVSGKVLGHSMSKSEALNAQTKTPKDMVFINPKIVRKSKKKALMEEGCLSVRWIYGTVERSEKATVNAYDETGTKFQAGGSGLIAQIFQHETDHLEGTLFIDKAKNLEEIPPESNQDAKKSK